MARFLRANDPLSAWTKAVQTVMERGIEIKDERGSLTKEVPNLMISISNPLSDNKKHDYWQGEKLEKYVSQLQDADKRGFIYTYGNRFCGGDLDQIEQVTRKIKENPNTRRAIMTTFDPVVDNTNEEIPCIIAVDFKVRHDELNTSAFWRSNDIYGAYYPNIMGISGISKRIANELGYKVGTLTTHAVSAHIYESNFRPANDLIKRKERGKR